MHRAGVTEEAATVVTMCAGPEGGEATGWTTTAPGVTTGIARGMSRATTIEALKANAAAGATIPPHGGMMVAAVAGRKGVIAAVATAAARGAEACGIRSPI